MQERGLSCLHSIGESKDFLPTMITRVSFRILSPERAKFYLQRNAVSVPFRPEPLLPSEFVLDV